MRQCAKCKQEKDESSFCRNKRMKDGLNKECRQCVSEYKSLPHVKERANELMREKRKNNPVFREEDRKRSAEYHKNNRERSNQKRREWTINHINSIKENGDDALLAYRDEERKRGKIYRMANKDKIILKNILYKLANEEKIRERHAVYRQTNREEINARHRAWTLNNRHKETARANKRRAYQMQATPSWEQEKNEFFFQEIYHLAQIRTKMTGVKHHVDHRVPITSNLVCGLHVPENLQVIEEKHNLSKGNKYWPDMPEPEKITQAA